MATDRTILPLMLGLQGPVLTAEERDWLRDHPVAAQIVFARNIDTVANLQRLTRELAELSPFAAPFLAVDQEGGRVQRVTFWGHHPAAAVFGAWWIEDPVAAVRACTLNAALLADGLRAVGLTWALGPVLDLPQPTAHKVIGDRAFGSTPEVVTAMGQAHLAGLALGGVWGCVKHAPGHGRALVDSHAALPRVAATHEALMGHDFQPFAALAGACPWVMTAHVQFDALDPNAPVTLSRAGVAAVQSFGGPLTPTSGQVVLADDVGMAALGGDYVERIAGALGAGCGMVIAALSQISAGMAGTVWAAADAAALRAEVAQGRVTPLAATVRTRLEGLTLPNRLSRVEAKEMLVEFNTLWDQGPGCQGQRLELAVAPC